MYCYSINSYSYSIFFIKRSACILLYNVFFQVIANEIYPISYAMYLEVIHYYNYPNYNFQPQLLTNTNNRFTLHSLLRKFITIKRIFLSY